MNLAAPEMLWSLLIVVVPFIGFLWWAWVRRQQLMTQFISSRLLTQLKVGVSPARQKARLFMIIAAVVLLILALARPQWGFTSEEARQRGLDIVVAIDTSKSMLAEDVPPNRLARAKLAALDLVRRAKTDRLGLVAFAGSAFLQCPLTLDESAFSQSVDSLDTHSISQGGTAIAEAIDEARKALKQEGDNHKVLVLFTDGEDQDTRAVAAAEQAAKEGMIIYTIGIGTADGEFLRVRDEQGRVNYLQDEQGNRVKSHLNEDLLQQIARTTKEGFYLPLRGSKTIDTLYEQGIARLPKYDTSVRFFQRYRERFYWPLGLAMALLLVEMFLPDRKLRRKRPVPAAPTRTASGALAETVVLFLLLSLPLTARGGGASGALREYNSGKYDQALKDYNQLLERKKDDPRLHFNAGAAAYQGQQLDEAFKQFNEALAAPDVQMQQHAYYNLGNTLFRQGEQMSEADKKQQAWEEAVKKFDSALKLNTQDADAKFNRDFVKQQLEVLKQQQQQQQQQSGKGDQKKDQKKDQDQKQDQQGKGDQSKDDKQDSQSGQKQDQQKQDSQAQKDQQDKKQDEQKKQDQAKNDSGKPDEKKDNAKNQGSGQQKEQSKEEAEREAAMMAAGQMTPTQAQQMLDSQKGEEQVWRLMPTNKPSGQPRTFKDW